MYHFLINMILKNYDLDDVTYIGLANLIAITFLLLFSFLIFIVIMASKEATTSSMFEFKLIRKHVWAWIYIFQCLLLSAEIISCWQFSWLTETKFFIPLWLVYIFSSFMAISLALPFRARGKKLKDWDAKTEKFKV